MQKSRNKRPLKAFSIDARINQTVRTAERILESLGFKLDSYQPHISGERQIKSLTKLILIGQNQNGQRVVIKTSRTASEKKRVGLERQIRQELEQLSKTVRGLLIPREVYYGQKNSFIFFITEFIEQPKIFVAHNLKEQFAMIKSAIESQEAVKGKTFPKLTGGRACPIFTEKKYLAELNRQINFINKNCRDKKLRQTLAITRKLFQNKMGLVAKYCGYLTHDDFCPHNFRVNNGQIHFLDYTAAHFGNKYITWARLLNYMTLHSPKLEQLILADFKKNRSGEDLECLRILRIYKTVFLIMYYVKISNKTAGRLLSLTRIRINFWHNFLQKLLENRPLSRAELSRYLKQRNGLRSPEEKKRQKEFAVA